MNPTTTAAAGHATSPGTRPHGSGPPEGHDAPPVPEALEEVGLSRESIAGLLLKTLYVQGARTGREIRGEVKLPFGLVDEILLDLQQRQFVEVRGTPGHGRGGYLFALTTEGRERAREELETSRYVGPAPVPLRQYREWTAGESVSEVHISRDKLADASGHVVVDDEVLDLLGPAVNSAKSIFLYGASGNGKTLIAEMIAGLFRGPMFVPYAIDVSGEIVVVYDPVHHGDPLPEPDAEPASSGLDEGDGREPTLASPPAHDPRYARVRRPVVITGGELTLDQLDLRYDPLTRVYQAPLQMKASGGVFVVDDLGRQRVPPRQLLNRWIVPLEKRQDYLTLHSGKKFPVPFDCLVVFSTNIDPEELVEEAFLRRIHYKIFVSDPSRDQYRELFRRECEERGIPFRPDAPEYVRREYYEKRGIPPRSCHPRDIVEHVSDVAAFAGAAPTLTEEFLRQACATYFVSTENGTPPAGET